MMNQMDTTPSVVHFNKAKTCFVGLKAFNQIDSEQKKTFKDFQNSELTDQIHFLSLNVL